MEYWLAAEVQDVNDNTEVEVVVIFKGELESARGLLVHLAVVAVLRKMLNRLDLDLVTCSLKNPK